MNYCYGINPVKEALRGTRKVFEVFLYIERKGEISNEIITLAEKRGVHVTLVNKSFFSSFPKGHQGVVARVGAGRAYTLEDLLDISHRKGERPFYLIIDGVVDPRNLGAIIRTAEVGGVHGIITQKRRVASGETVAKASAGAIAYMPLVRVSNIKHVIRELKGKSIKIFGAEADAENVYWSADLTLPVALVIGSEGKGLRETVKNYCDSMIKIPVKGRINSLNVSVATGILIYETLRQRTSL